MQQCGEREGNRALHNVCHRRALKEGDREQYPELLSREREWWVFYVAVKEERYARRQERQPVQETAGGREVGVQHERDLGNEEQVEESSDAARERHGILCADVEGLVQESEEPVMTPGRKRLAHVVAGANSVENLAGVSKGVLDGKEEERQGMGKREDNGPVGEARPTRRET